MLNEYRIVYIVDKNSLELMSVVVKHERLHYTVEHLLCYQIDLAPTWTYSKVSNWSFANKHEYSVKCIVYNTYAVWYTKSE